MNDMDQHRTAQDIRALWRQLERCDRKMERTVRLLMLWCTIGGFIVGAAVGILLAEAF